MSVLAMVVVLLMAVLQKRSAGLFGAAACTAGVTFPPRLQPTVMDFFEVSAGRRGRPVPRCREKRLFSMAGLAGRALFRTTNLDPRGAMGVP
jgi:hypothetical protein